jgi:GNAT superfamily N-acetyltransferase
VTRPAVVRAAGPGDVAELGDVERSAGLVFAAAGMVSVASHEPPAPAVYEHALAAGRLWVAEDADGRVVGYAMADVVDGEAHLEQVSVRDEAQGRGTGTALVARVERWAREQGFAALTLTTFVDVPWNGPWYRRLGFEAVPEPDLGPGLRAVRAAETARGVDVAPRTAMRKLLGPPA